MYDNKPKRDGGKKEPKSNLANRARKGRVNMSKVRENFRPAEYERRTGKSAEHEYKPKRSSSILDVGRQITQQNQSASSTSGKGPRPVMKTGKKINYDSVNFNNKFIDMMMKRAGLR